MEVKAPDRAWDYETGLYGGIWVWFEELIYIDGTGIANQMEVDQSTNKLKKKGAQPCKRCNGCETGSYCHKVFLPQVVQDARDKWWYDIFESKVMGTE